MDFNVMKTLKDHRQTLHLHPMLLKLQKIIQTIDKVFTF